MADDLTQQNTLRKEVLGIGDAIAQSIAVLALVMAIALSTSFAAQFAGAAAPLAYVVAGLGSLCLAYVVIRFTRRMASAVVSTPTSRKVWVQGPVLLVVGCTPEHLPLA